MAAAWGAGNSELFTKVILSYIGVQPFSKTLLILDPPEALPLPASTPLHVVRHDGVRRILGARFGVNLAIDPQDHTGMLASTRLKLLDEAGNMISIENLTVGQHAGSASHVTLYMLATEHVAYMSESFIAPGRGRKTAGQPLLYGRLEHVSEPHDLMQPRLIVHSATWKWDNPRGGGGAGGAGNGGGGGGGPAAVMPMLWATELEGIVEPVPDVQSLRYVEGATETHGDQGTLALMAQDPASVGVLRVYNILLNAVPPFVRADMFGPEGEACLNEPWLNAYPDESHEEAFTSGQGSALDEMEKIERGGGKPQAHIVRRRILAAFRFGISHMRRALLTFDIVFAPAFISVADACAAHPFFCPEEFETMRAMLVTVVEAARVRFGIE